MLSGSELLHDAVSVPGGVLLLLQRGDVDVQIFDLSPDGAHRRRRHVFSQLRHTHTRTQVS